MGEQMSNSFVIFMNKNESMKNLKQYMIDELKVDVSEVGLIQQIPTTTSSSTVPTVSSNTPSIGASVSKVPTVSSYSPSINASPSKKTLSFSPSIFSTIPTNNISASPSKQAVSFDSFAPSNLPTPIIDEILLESDQPSSTPSEEPSKKPKEKKKTKKPKSPNKNSTEKPKKKNENPTEV